MGKTKTKKSPQKATEAGGDVATKKVDFKNDVKPAVANNKPVGGLRPSPSMNTLSRLDREKVTIWRRPFTTFYYAVAELICLVSEGLVSLLQYRRFLTVVSLLAAVATYFYVTPGPHQAHVGLIESKLGWWSWWVMLGVLSSIGLGSGLHTFLLYLGPHIAAVTLAAYECNSLDFPEPPYPNDIVCPSTTTGAAAVTLWSIVAKIRVEAFLWGVGTAIGELPPYFMARAARLSGNEPDDEEYREFLELLEAGKKADKGEMGLVDRAKAWMEKTVAKVGFFGILACASVPNPLFDLAGITCGHFLVPFWTFFGATVIGKAVVKMHVQMLFVIVVFSAHHVEHALSLLDGLPAEAGKWLRGPIEGASVLDAPDCRYKSGFSDALAPCVSDVRDAEGGERAREERGGRERRRSQTCSGKPARLGHCVPITPGLMTQLWEGTMTPYTWACTTGRPGGAWLEALDSFMRHVALVKGSGHIDDPNEMSIVRSVSSSPAKKPFGGAS